MSFIYIYFYFILFCCNNDYWAGLCVLQQSRSSLQRSAVATCHMSFIYLSIYIYIYCCSNYWACLPLRVATVTKLTSALALSCCNLPYVVYLFIYILFQQLTAFLCLLQHSALTGSCCNLPYVCIYFYFFVATITEPAFLCLLQQSRSSLQRSALSCCNLPYVVYLYIYIYCCNNYQARLPLPVAILSSYWQLLQLAVCIYIYILLQQLLSLPSSACCNSHEAHFSTQRSAVATAVCRLSIYIYYFFVATITKPPQAVATLSAQRSVLNVLNNWALSCCNLPYVVYLYILFIFNFFNFFVATITLPCNGAIAGNSRDCQVPAPFASLFSCNYLTSHPPVYPHQA